MNKELSDWQQCFEERITYELEQQGHQDAAHDLSHVRRVWQHCQTINEQDNFQVEPLVLLAAAYFHDIVNVPKDSKDRAQASRLAAERAVEILRSLNFPAEHLNEIGGAIQSHSYSANLTPESDAAKIVQDADRLEALGALGIARLFYVAGQMNSQLFAAEDPWAKNRQLNDKQYALDHFYVKLFNIEKTMQTNTGRQRAEELSEQMQGFLNQFKKEIS
ncbi:MAG: HD domain-containing protein [Gammaproteobacteria bacterium]|nr:HD domain-containing protein [Gammaproteobacteria bacterium]